MDVTALNLSYKVSIYGRSNLRVGFLNSYSNSFSFSKLSCFTERRSSAITVSYRAPSGPDLSRNRCTHCLPTNPFCVLIPVLQSIRDFAGLAASGTRRGYKWLSCLRGCGDSGGVSNEWGGDYFHNGGIGVALLSVTSTAKVRISPVVATLAANPTFVSGLLAWVAAQSIKVFLNFFVERKWDFRILFASGGMPSSHSALCTALTTSVALCHGVADSLFPVCLGFTLIVMYDAIGVRRHAGMQAEGRWREEFKFHLVEWNRCWKSMKGGWDSET
ncbi:PREDICTED: uncharacterized protein LOC104604791 isoform X2 [Nelumbo nucifera]|uniref:Uncharacterized protein LOC104604791 isoform X2 n=1 Tax=Nelumbo nucifera TaxID=4432 RepID=A0A1U8AIU0_NELNU|nr:PREDICTED: uncharacterized protein LOC104604791 isoform X2 [Nelumbo nucifera]